MPVIPLAELTTHPEPELVFAVVSAVGTDQDEFERLFKDLVAQFGYSTNVLRLSEMVDRIHTERVGAIVNKTPEYNRIDSYMTAGNTLRRLAGRGDVLALHAVGAIRKSRPVSADGKTEPIPKSVHLLRSLKHPAEVEALRRVYGTGFFLIGLHGSQKQRLDYLTKRKGMTEEEARNLMERDRSEIDKLGQQTRDTFTMSDVFVQSEHEQDQLGRFLDIVFDYPYETPTLDEHAMYLAYGASLRSGQLARQVGAVIVSADGEVIATGANDVPKFGGGLYWRGPGDQRDHILGYDSNDVEIDGIIADIMARVKQAAAFFDEDHLRRLLEESRVDDLTEYGRPVHAEMEAILACGRVGVSPKGGTLYTTTFPCHNCAKHIVAAGIDRVIYVEPYPKSKALTLHGDSIALDKPDAKDRVRFLPFVGVAPRRYFDLFSMRLGSGLPMKRKAADGKVIPWVKGEARPRIRMAPYSYLERELIAMAQIEPVVATMEQQAAADSDAVTGSGGPSTGESRGMNAEEVRAAIKREP
jgi:deoxycytidylate deaminase